MKSKHRAYILYMGEARIYQQLKFVDDLPETFIVEPSRAAFEMAILDIENRMCSPRVLSVPLAKIEMVVTGYDSVIPCWCVPDIFKVLTSGTDDLSITGGVVRLLAARQGNGSPAVNRL